MDSEFSVWVERTISFQYQVRVRTSWGRVVVAATFTTLQDVPDSGKVAAEAYAALVRKLHCEACERSLAARGDDLCRDCRAEFEACEAEDRAHALAATRSLGL